MKKTSGQPTCEVGLWTGRAVRDAIPEHIVCLVRERAGDAHGAVCTPPLQLFLKFGHGVRPISTRGHYLKLQRTSARGSARVRMEVSPLATT